MIEDTLMKMDGISLEEMSAVKLMNRIDTKFITTETVLDALLRKASEHFLVQESNGIRNANYYTRYYDTEDVRMYYDHQRGKKSRRKIRIREYVDSDLQPFLEIKDKNNKGRTKKRRVSMDTGLILNDFAEFISRHSEFFVNDLDSKIENRFRRITLVNKEKTERITIDTSIEFHNFVTDREIILPGIVIIEWKRDGLSMKSHLKPLLRELKIRESGFSKYVVGMALTDDELPHNKIKPRLRMLEKLNY
ncbi:MAG: polyphosphate polymerase domain-containing protein [Muribaculaceae bacterium]|nr:polyphosphate polymerase domain-containing protein [Muribaculaceae bacterium]